MSGGVSSDRELDLWFPKGSFNGNASAAGAGGGGGGGEGPAAVGPGDPQYDELMSYMKEKASLTKITT